MNGLYDCNEWKDSCGFGLIAQIKGEVSHGLVRTAIEALACMTHRGGIAADGRTGDGCGLLLQKPDAFLRRVALECGAGELTPLYGVGTLMFAVARSASDAGFLVSLGVRRMKLRRRMASDA